MASTMFFGGRTYTTPVVASAVNDDAMEPQSAGIGYKVAFLGKATGGRPKTVMRASSPSNAKTLVSGGELLIAAKKGFAPSVDTAAPSEIILIRVGQATGATLSLAGGGAAAIALTAADRLWGLPGNQIKVRVEDASLRGKRLTAVYKTETYTQDNVARDLLTLRYAGTGTGTAQVTGTGIVLTLNAVATTVTFADFGTVQELADRIAAIAGMSAVVASGASARPSANQFDRLAATDCKTADLTLRGDVAAAVDWFNSDACPILSAVRAAADVNTLTSGAYAYLAGATDPATTTQDWQDALDVLQLVDVQRIVPLTSAGAVHAMVDTHVRFMWEVGRKERRAFVGPALGTTQDGVIALAKALGSDRTAMVWPGVIDYDDSGALVTYPPYITAALVAAGFTGLTPGETMTAKSLRVQGLEVTPRNPVDTDLLIQGGVCCIGDEEDDGFRVVRAVSTWQTNNKYNRVEISCGEATDATVREVRAALKGEIGTGNDPIAGNRRLAKAETALRWCATAKPIGPGYIVGDENSPAYSGLRNTIDGDKDFVAFECSPVIPNNFIGVSVSLKPYSGTATAEA